MTPFVGQSVRDKCRALILGQPLGSPTATFASEGQLLETSCLSKIVLLLLTKHILVVIVLLQGSKADSLVKCSAYICMCGATPRHCFVFNHQLLCPFVLFVSNMMMITTLSLREKEKGEAALIFSC